MLRLTIVTVLVAVVALVLVFELMRRRRLREKYAAIWLVIALTSVVLAFFPGLLTAAAEVIGIRTPSNLLFLASLLILFAVSLQLSGEVGILEEQTRRLAEEVAALRMRMDATAPPQPSTGHHPGVPERPAEPGSSASSESSDA